MTREERTELKAHIKTMAKEHRLSFFAECFCEDAGNQQPGPHTYGIELCCITKGRRVLRFLDADTARRWLCTLL